MNVTTIYNSMIEKLKAKGRIQIANDLDALIRSGSTGGEILSSTGKYISDLRRSNSEAYASISEQAEKYLEYCKQNGILIK